MKCGVSYASLIALTSGNRRTGTATSRPRMVQESALFPPVHDRPQDHVVRQVKVSRGRAHGIAKEFRVIRTKHKFVDRERWVHGLVHPDQRIDKYDRVVVDAEIR
jgi:hypothetical protein